jgi:hypothetical protein
MGHLEKNELTSQNSRPEIESESLVILGLLPTKLRREQTTAAKVAEGEELGSNLLRVDQRSSKQWFERTRGKREFARLHELQLVLAMPAEV